MRPPKRAHREELLGLPGGGAGSDPGRGTYADIPVDQAHVDGTLVTAPAWPAHPTWLAQFLEVLGTKISL